MIYWINGPYGVGNAIRENRPSCMFNGYIFEGYRLWFVTIVEFLKEITEHFDGDVYIPMTLVYEDSFQKIQKPLEECGIAIKHILLESNYEVVHDRILARGEEENCWCINNIELCLNNPLSWRAWAVLRKTQVGSKAFVKCRIFSTLLLDIDATSSSKILLEGG